MNGQKIFCIIQVQLSLISAQVCFWNTAVILDTKLISVFAKIKITKLLWYHVNHWKFTKRQGTLILKVKFAKSYQILANMLTFC